MPLIFICLSAMSLSLTSFTAVAQDQWRSAPLDTPPPRAYPVLSDGRSTASASAMTAGRPENRWRYRVYRGQWWYWTPNNQWSYFNGTRWATYRTSGGFSSEKVDPALLRLEAKEGTLGPKRWSQPGGVATGPAERGAIGWALSGTQGSLGGAPTSSFTFPSDVSRAGGIQGASPSWRPAGGMGGAPRGR